MIGLACEGLISQAGLSAAGEQREAHLRVLPVHRRSPEPRAAQRPGGRLLVAERAMLGWGRKPAPPAAGSEPPARLAPLDLRTRAFRNQKA